MIDKSEKNLFEVPCADGSITKLFNAPSHLGIDFGWSEIENCDITSIQDGTVVDVFSERQSPTCGNSIVIQHDYSDGTHRWSAYIHLLSCPNLKIGTNVKRGQCIGKKGSTGKSSGTHLHIFISNVTTKKYDWDLMKSLCNFNPLPCFYRSSNKKYLGESYKKMNLIEKQLPSYPEPVARDEKTRQVEVLIDCLFMRDAPAGNAYGSYTPMGIFNIHAEQVASLETGTYNWYLIDTINGKEYWIASGDKRTRDLDPTK